jgi:hypothetical protein
MDAEKLQKKVTKQLKSVHSMTDIDDILKLIKTHDFKCVFRSKSGEYSAHHFKQDDENPLRVSFMCSGHNLPYLSFATIEFNRLHEHLDFKVNDGMGRWF